MIEEIGAQCPNCEDTAGRVEKNRQGGEITATMTCAECGTEWTSVLRFGS